MAKVLKLEGTKVIIGLNGSIIESQINNCYSDVKVGDEVEIFQNEEVCHVVKKEEKTNLNQNDLMGTDINKRVVNKSTYIILCLLLGGYGGHKFYAGKTGAGILSIIFFWTLIPSIIAFIDLIKACCINSDSNGNILV